MSLCDIWLRITRRLYKNVLVIYCIIYFCSKPADSLTNVHGDVSQCAHLCSYSAISVSAMLIGIFGVLFAISAILTVSLKIKGGQRSRCCKVRSKCNHRVFPDRNRMTNSRVVRLEPLNNTTHDDNGNYHHFVVNLH